VLIAQLIPIGYSISGSKCVYLQPYFINYAIFTALSEGHIFVLSPHICPPKPTLLLEHLALSPPNALVTTLAAFAPNATGK
jgi:hypothetical protein